MECVWKGNIVVEYCVCVPNKSVASCVLQMSVRVCVHVYFYLFCICERQKERASNWNTSAFFFHVKSWLLN